MLRRRVGGGSWKESEVKPGKQQYSLIPLSPPDVEAERRVDSYWEGEGGRCVRCAMYFSNSSEREQNPCISHPGVYEKGGFGFTWKVVVGKWTCCASKDEDGKGCRVENYHVQCQDTLQALKRIGVNANSEGLRLPEQCENKSPITETIKATGSEDQEPNERPGYIKYLFKPSDTLPGVALAHNVTVQDIKRANGIVGTFLDPGHKCLWIPLPGTDPQAGKENKDGNSLKARIAELRALAAREGLNVSQPEAKYYLEEDGGDVGRAFESLKSDIAWEKENAGPLEGNKW